MCLWTETELKSINTQKKNKAKYPAILTEQAWSIKDLLWGFRGNLSWGTQWVVPSGQDSSILPARVANHSIGFDSSCPLTKLFGAMIAPNKLQLDFGNLNLVIWNFPLL